MKAGICVSAFTMAVTGSGEVSCEPFPLYFVWYLAQSTEDYNTWLISPDSLTKFGSRGKSESQSYGSDDSPWMSGEGREGEGFPTVYPIEALMRQTVGMQGLVYRIGLQSTGRGKKEAYEKK